MGNFTAKLALPRYISKDGVLRKYVFDSELQCIGFARDWTYTSDGDVKIVVGAENESGSSPDFLIPFSQIEKIGQFIVLKTKKKSSWKLEKKPENTEESILEGTEISKSSNSKKREDKTENNLKYFTEIDEEKLDLLLKKKN